MDRPAFTQNRGASLLYCTVVYLIAVVLGYELGIVGDSTQRLFQIVRRNVSEIIKILVALR